MDALEAVVFDLDDTLYLERSYVFSGFAAVADWIQVRFGASASTTASELEALFLGGAKRDAFDRWAADHDLVADEVVPRMVRVYREHAPRLSLTSDTRELLERFRARFRLGLITDGALSVQRGKVDALALAPFFDTILVTSELGEGHSKPSPRPFSVVLERLGVEGRGAVYVADNPTKDFLGPRRVGMWTIRCRRPEGLYSHLEPPDSAHAPHAEIGSLDALEGALCSVGAEAERLRRAQQTIYAARGMES